MIQRVRCVFGFHRRERITTDQETYARCRACGKIEYGFYDPPGMSSKWRTPPSG